MKKKFHLIVFIAGANGNLPGSGEGARAKCLFLDLSAIEYADIVLNNL